MTTDPTTALDEPTRARIALLASEGIPPFLDTPGLAPEPMTAADVLTRREVVEARLAALGGYHGWEQDFWWAWLAVTRDGGADPAEKARALRPAQASWFAMWCFAVGDVDLGCALFEDLIERPRIAVGAELHHHLVVLCLLWHLVHRRPAAALRVGERYLIRLGRKPEVMALTAVASHRSGAIDLATAGRELARLRPTPSGRHVGVLALAHELAGDAAGARRTLALLHAGTTFFPPDERVLRAVFGDELSQATSRPPPPPPSRVRWRGLVLERSSRASEHRFAPATPANTRCPGCQTSLLTTFRIRIDRVPRLAPMLPRWASFDAVACFDCSYWMARHDLVHDADGHVVEAIAIDAGDDLRKRFEATPSPPPQFVKTRPAPATLADKPLDGECQLGGNPAWIQSAEEVRCGRCDAAMVFVLRFAAPNGFVGSPEVAGGSGALYHFACPTCPTSARIAQWT